MVAILNFLYFLVNSGLEVAKWLLIISAVLSWLIAFNVINTHNDLVRQIWSMLSRFSDFLCAPIRRMLPDLGGIDLSPLVVIILIIGVQGYLLPPFFSALIGLVS
jgi:YggT family protein